jgi:putative membrane protein (TIGR04086 family)
MPLKISSTLKSKNCINFGAILYGTIIAVIISVLFMAVGGTIMYYTNYTDEMIPLIGLAIMFISIFTGGLITAKKAGKYGWLHGLCVGLIFLLITVLYNFAFPGSIIGFSVIKKILASVFAGCLGGIWGVGRN